MANLKEVRIRIASVQSTEKITAAMKMVSAVKLRRSQTAILKLRPYSKKLNEILSDLSQSNEESDNVFAQPHIVKKEEEKVLLIVITSNKGLCGGFNASVIKETQKLIYEKYAVQAKHNHLSLICIGKRGYDFFAKKSYPILKKYETILDNPVFDEVSEMATDLMTSYKNKQLDVVEIIYNEFKNAANQVLKVENYLPIQSLESSNAKQLQKVDYIFEPNKEIIFKELVPKILKIQLYKTILDSIASEHGARMTAMHKATENADELIKELSISYNKARQVAITNEISEIVSGADSLNS